MRTTLIAIAVLVVGYVSAYLVFDRLRVRFGYAGGAEYVLLGVLLGPEAAGLMSADAVRGLTPVASLALGWLGMSLGTYFRLPTLATGEPAFLKVAFAHAVAAFALALGAFYGGLRYLLAFSPEAAGPLAATLAAIATLSSTTAIDAFAVNPQRAGHPLFPALQLTGRICGLVGVVGFGVVLAVFHQGEVAPTVRAPTATEWAVINVAVGVTSGVLFHLFLGPAAGEARRNGASRLFVAVAAAIVIASGASYYLNLSPVFTSLILGFVLANTGNAHRDVQHLLAATGRPIYVALLIFAGAAWTPARPDLLFIAPAFVGIRLLAHYLAGRVAGTRAAPDRVRAPQLGRAVLAQGGVGVALALNYVQVFPDLRPNVVLTSALLSVLLFEIVATTETARFLDARSPA